jgi:hypothetical protein
MNLSQTGITGITSLVHIALTVGVDRLVIGDGKIRGIDDKRTVGIVTTNNVPDIGGKTVVLNRLKQLSTRLSLASAQGDVTVDATLAANDTEISILTIKGGKSKGQFRCAAIEAVKGVPKGFSDPVVWELSVRNTLIPLLAQADSSMNADGITIASKDGKAVTIELVDTNKDVMTFELEDEATWVGTATAGDSFCNKYPSKSLLTLLREAAKTDASVKLCMGDGGLLFITINGYEFFTLPQA